MLTAFLNSFIQSSLVVLLCFFISIVSFRALYSFDLKKRTFVKNLLIAPILLPSIFSILIAMSLIKPFPFGMGGIVVIFFLVHFGYYFVALHEVVEAKIGQQFLVKQVYNIRALNFVRLILFPQIRRDIFNLSIIIFISCFSSLSIPLIASGGRSTNFELFIYETIFIENDWNSAIVLSLIQASILLCLSFFSKLFKTTTSEISINEFGLKSPLSLIFVTSYLFAYYGVFIFKTIPAFFLVKWASFDYMSFVFSLANSFQLFLILGICFSLLVFCLSFLNYQGRSVGFFKLFLMPSSVIVGFSFYLYFSVGSTTIDLLKMSLGLFVISSFGLFFNFLAPQLRQLRNQILVANIYEIDFLIYSKYILWPQIKSLYVLCLSILLLLSLTDFAIIKAVGSQTETLGTFIFSYLSSYRLEWSYVFCFFTLIIWLIFLKLSEKVTGKSG
jgi:thiamine transport system permease protein